MVKSGLYYNDGQERAIFLFFLVLLAWLPIPLGSNREWAWSLFEALSSVLLAWTAMLIIGRRISVPAIVSQSKTVIFLLILSVSFIGFQLVPFSIEQMKLLSPLHLDLFSSISLNKMMISIDRNTTIQAMLKQLAYVNLFLLALILLNSKHRIKLLLFVVALGGVFQSILAISQWISAASMDNAYAASGTFVNKNHFAAYLNMVIASIFGLIMFESYASSGRKRGLLLRLTASRNVLYGFLTIAMFALIVTQSRGAGLSFIIALLSLLFCIGLNPMGRKRFGVKLFVSVIACLAITVSLGYETITERIVSAESDASSRIEIWNVTEKVTQDYPWFGIGAGNYATIIPQYGTRNMTVFINHAHNDYLELLTEQGLVGTSIYILLLLVCGITTLRTIVATKSTEVLISSVVGVFATVSMLSHAVVDFNFYIPSNAGYFYVFLALMLYRSEVKKQSKNIERESTRLKFA